MRMRHAFRPSERQRLHDRLKAARERGVRLGRAPTSPKLEARIRELLPGGMGQLKVARQLGIGTSVVQRIAAASD